jgi:hypothetical protein
MGYLTLQHLTTRGWALAQRLKPQSASSRNVLKLAGGTAGSQVISVAAAPILTRLYGPESFGGLAMFVSLLSLLNLVGSLSYKLDIPLPEDDVDNANLAVRSPLQGRRMWSVNAYERHANRMQC